MAKKSKSSILVSPKEGPFTPRIEWSLRMLNFYLARQGHRRLPLSAVAFEMDISISYIEQIMAPLRRLNLFSSARGPGGGYRIEVEELKNVSFRRYTEAFYPKLKSNKLYSRMAFMDQSMHELLGHQ